jgi:hypothetical protein
MVLIGGLFTQSSSGQGALLALGVVLEVDEGVAVLTEAAHLWFYKETKEEEKNETLTYK